MPRLTAIDPATATGKAKEIFDGPLAGKHLNIFKSMANSPATLQAYLALAGALGDSVLSDKEREIIQLAVGQANNCEYCVAAHTAIGKGAGLTDDQALGARRGTVDGDAKLDALAKFALAIHEKKGFVSNEDLSTFKAAGYDDAAVADTVTTYALAVFTNYFNHVNETEIDLPAAPAL
ncbi:MAG: carboxymuconolactone decarboxylase family protein [Planctomycetota bacterium]